MTAELLARFSKRYASGTSVTVDFRQPVDRFSITVLFGPSGSGKTTILRCLAGLERPDEGMIRLGEQTWFDDQQRRSLRPQQRQIGYLFQEYALFPHLDVAANIAYGLRRLPAAERQRRVAELLDLFGLEGLQRRMPHQVSGGQQQRIALARALACKPRLLLLDEPLSALDTSLRERLRGELRQLLSRTATPALVVTHDRTEAIALADQVLVLHEGRVRQAGPPDEVFGRPADLTVAEMVGVDTVLPAVVVSNDRGLARIRVRETELLAVGTQQAGESVFACVRAEDVVLQKGDPAATSARNRLAGRVLSRVPEGPLVRVTLDCGFRLTALVTRPAAQELQLAAGDAVTALIKSPAIHLLPRGA